MFALALGLHLSIFALGIPAFPQMALALGVALIPPERFSDAASAAAARAGDPASGRAARSA